jgi:hypothetical protein
MSILSVNHINGSNGRITVSSILNLSESKGIILPKWDTAGRPNPAELGFTGYNYEEDVWEVYNGTNWEAIDGDYETSLPPVTNGLTVYMTGDSWDAAANVWRDLSGNGNDSSGTSGTISVATHTGGNGASGVFKYITGDTSAGVAITNGWPNGADYTFFHITRYTGGSRSRIWQGKSGNWLSGHWGGGSGKFYHEGWLSSSGTDYYGNDWFITMDQRSNVRTNRGTHSFTSGGSYSPNGIAINGQATGGCCGGEASDWATAVIAVYNRALSASEYQQVEDFLYNTYVV